VHVTDTGRPFAITSAADDVQAGAPVTLTWDVAGTADEPILCSYVRIDVSTDGGEHFGLTPLLQDAPNTGEATFELPAGTTPTRHGRFRVMCGNDTFFAISPRDITVR
jgi:hypothetical protein